MKPFVSDRIEAYGAGERGGFDMDRISEVGNGESARTASDVGEQVIEGAQDALERLRESASELDRRIRKLVHDHPTASVVGAVAVGFLVGRFLVRR